jgi:hypothetical protein
MKDPSPAANPIGRLITPARPGGMAPLPSLHQCGRTPPPGSARSAPNTDEDTVIKAAIVNTRRSITPLHMDKPWREKSHSLARSLALKLLFVICLTVTLVGCVSTREGDYDTPEFAANRRPL